MRYVFWLLLAAGLIWAWKNPDKVRDASDVASKWIGEQSRVLADKWDPQPKKDDSPKEQEVVLTPLPEDVYILRQDVMVSSRGAIVKWPAGSSVRKLGEGGGKVLVSDGTNQTAVESALLTRDEQERKALYRRVQASSAGQAKAVAQSLERELAEVESKIYSLQNEKRQLERKEMEYGQAPMSTTVEFLNTTIKSHERRRLEIHKQLGRSSPPPMLIAK